MGISDVFRIVQSNTSVTVSDSICVSGSFLVIVSGHSLRSGFLWQIGDIAEISAEQDTVSYRKVHTIGIITESYSSCYNPGLFKSYHEYTDS